MGEESLENIFSKEIDSLHEYIKYYNSRKYGRVNDVIADYVLNQGFIGNIIVIDNLGMEFHYSANDKVEPINNFPVIRIDSPTIKTGTLVLYCEHE